MSDELRGPQRSNKRKLTTRPLAQPDSPCLNLEFQIGKHETSGLAARTLFSDRPSTPGWSSYSPSQYRMAGRDCGDAGTSPSSGLRLWDRHLGIQTWNSLLDVSRLPCGRNARHGLDGPGLSGIHQSHHHCVVVAFADNRLVRLRLGKASRWRCRSHHCSRDLCHLVRTGVLRAESIHRSRSRESSPARPVSRHVRRCGGGEEAVLPGRTILWARAVTSHATGSRSRVRSPVFLHPKLEKAGTSHGCGTPPASCCLRLGGCNHMVVPFPVLHSLLMGQFRRGTELMVRYQALVLVCGATSATLRSDASAGPGGRSPESLPGMGGTYHHSLPLVACSQGGTFPLPRYTDSINAGRPRAYRDRNGP